MLRSGSSDGRHPFAHVALTETTPAKAAEELMTRLGARVALNICAKGTMTSRGTENISSSDMRLLAVHALTRKVRVTIEGASVLTISEKGQDVLALTRKLERK